MGLNLEKALYREKDKDTRDNHFDVLEEVKSILAKDDLMDQNIHEKIRSDHKEYSKLNVSELDPDRVFHLKHIRTLCTNYRLRFLDAKHFKAEIPYEAISRIKELERSSSERVSNFKILAPASLFELKEKDRDPLLFIALSPEHYYLVHKWGNDLHPLRGLLMYPFRNFQSLITSVALLAFLIAIAVPNSVVMGPYDETSIGIRAIFFIFLFLAFSGLTVLYGFSRMKNFNANLWNSQYTS